MLDLKTVNLFLLDLVKGNGVMLYVTVKTVTIM